ncbi:MAG: Flp family type IVb pilin [Parvibaculum sp.]|jgi:pilus assembly protein Flp/PilA|uniref:Flp family type IVb pilin n=1 Tax=Parvibaculum sp. TaxID=2024848 RepID=UPI0026CC1FBA|nr:Flp family type IVb pilin [Parvibaculum sp.]MDR3497699.1 Flp family type IVb pilin [Parvibaculum sp.]
MSKGGVLQMIKRFIADERGATALEYGLMLAIFSLVVTTALASVGTNLTAMFQKIVVIFS